jgi:DNA repair protein RecO (recombination protein O)
VRRPKSKLAGHVEPLSHTSFLLAKGRELDIITQAQALELFQPLREDLERTGRALYVAELVERFTPERQESYPVFRLLLESLRRLCNEAALDIILRFFEMRLLDYLGYRPQLQECVGCGSALRPQSNNWSVEGGGAGCPDCSRDEPIPRPLSLNALKVMRLLQAGDFPDAARLRLTPPLAVEIERHLREYLFYLLERDVHSTRFLDTLRHMQPGPAQMREG